MSRFIEFDESALFFFYILADTLVFSFLYAGKCCNNTHAHFKAYRISPIFPMGDNEFQFSADTAGHPNLLDKLRSSQ